MLREHADGGGTRRWLHTGDLGYLDEDGYVFIVDRKKDMIKTSGFQVWPREIEEALATHPPWPRSASRARRIRSRAKSCTRGSSCARARRATEQELRAYCRERLAPYKVPARVEFRDSLPKTMVGKVLRRALRGRVELTRRPPIALTATPAASRPARSLAARSSAPGVSPWTQIVSTSSRTIEPSTAVTDLSFAIRIARDTTASASWMTAPGCLPGDERAVRLVGAIGERLGGDAQPGGAARLQQLRTGQPEQNQRRIERGDGAGDRAGERGVPRGHVEERAVRLHVLQSDAFGGRHAGDRGDLIEHEILGFLRRHDHLAPAEAGEIGKARDGRRRPTPCCSGGADRRAENGGVAGVESGGDVGRRHRLHQAGVMRAPMRVGAERLRRRPR